jgi:hypothetical protein
MRYAVIAVWLALCPVASAVAAVNVSIGINIPTYPRLVPVPGYPVYYAPGVDSNYFFYEGLYWDFDGDQWYSSPWYNGPWHGVAPELVPLFLLRVPVRYYRHPPAFFRGWRADVAPRWGDHWGRDWEQRRVGWDHWDHRSVPRAAPLPAYQRQYSGSRYPQEQRQQELHVQNYRYQARDADARAHAEQHYQPRESGERRGGQERDH